VDLSSAEDTSRLAFVNGNGPLPNQVEPLHVCKDDQQMQFAPHDNAGVISAYISTAGVIITGIIWKAYDKKLPLKQYAICPFYKQQDTSNWHVIFFITENQLIFVNGV
jgi:hypothetical protein